MMKLSFDSIITKVLNLTIFHLLSDRTFIKIKYYSRLKRRLDLNNPVTFNEKLQWLKLYDRRDIYTTMVDKFGVKKYVEDIIGDEYIIPTIGVYNSFDEIDFSKLPNKFVIKCTHDSGGLVISKDKTQLRINEARKRINRYLKRNYYYFGREWPYKNVNPRIIIEKYMVDKKTNELKDYKFFCFNGVVRFFKIDFNRFIKHQANYYDKNGILLKFGEAICPPDFNKKIVMPINLKKMVKLAEKLSKGIPFVRVDFYDVDGNIYFGEMTFFPASGFGKFIPEEWDEKIGRMLKLPLEKKGL